MTTAENIKALLESGNVLKGHVYGDEQQEMWFEGTVENIASFIASRPCVHHMILTDCLDRFVLSTIGSFIDQCPDQELCNRVKEYLVPMQMGEKAPTKVFSPSVQDVEKYCSGCEV